MSLISAARRSAAVAAFALLLAAPAAAQAAAPPAPENSVGILALLDAQGGVLSEGSTTAQPGFAAALAPAPCPAGFADAARVSVVPAGGAAVVISATVPLADAAKPAEVPVQAVLADYAVGSGATVLLECLAVQGGIPVPAATVFSVGLDISGSAFAVVPKPVLPSTPPASPVATATPTPTQTPTPAPSSAAAQTPSDAATMPAAGSGTGATANDLASTGSAALPLLFGAGLLSAAGAGLLLWRRGRASHS